MDAAAALTRRPVATLPVNATLATPGWPLRARGQAGVRVAPGGSSSKSENVARRLGCACGQSGWLLQGQVGVWVGGVGRGRAWEHSRFVVRAR